ncbi:hypothetical protein [Deminuibacter soli]|nr:hypothetical protein [Deminuibacter soli]
MKKILFLFAIVLFAAGAAQAQTQDSTAVKSQHQHNHMGKAHHKNPFRELNLTKDQNDKIKAISQDGKAKRQEIMNNTALSDADKKQQLKALHNSNRKAIAAVLTPDQQTKLKEMQKNRRQHSPKNQGTSPNDTTPANS